MHCFAVLVYNEKRDSLIMSGEKKTEISEADLVSLKTDLGTKESITFAKYNILFPKM